MRFHTSRFSLPALAISALIGAGLLLGRPGMAHAQNCSSTDPADWPPPARPYFMVAFDTSGSMNGGVGSNNSCGYAPLTWRVSHGRCAVWNTILAFAGLANFGLATFPRTYTCTGTCYNTCTTGGSSCGTGDGVNRSGALIRVPIVTDAPGQTSNVNQLLTWVDGTCSGTDELFPYGSTPIAGLLRDMYRYYSNSWTGGGTTYTSPLRSTAQGEMACRSVNVILITDGGENCDTAAEAVDAAHDLYTGFTKDGITWHVRTWVIAFGGSVAGADNIADAGDDGVSNNSIGAFNAANEVELSQALATIITQAIQPEVCDNGDNNCNGCVDEGFAKYCNTRATCCSWSNTTQRNACISSYEASIATNPPNGNLDLLPCTTAGQQSDPTAWLCYNPGEDCDGADNNCDGQIDEDLALNACGTCGPAPAEIPCNGIDDDCNPLTLDEPAGCTCGQEFCDGIDNDCDGLIDQNDPDYVQGNEPCGPNPALGECRQGTLVCNYPSAPTCTGAVYPVDETCDGRDENCNGIIDDVVYTPEECVIPNCTTACCEGHWECVNGTDTCVPNSIQATEDCDGVDNDCDGRIDEGAQCQQPYVCWFGDCAFRVPPDGCGTGYIEREGLCVVDPCRGTTCPGGTICEPSTGDCVDPCDSYTCTDPADLCDVTLATCDASGTCEVDDTACVTPDCYLDPSLCADGEVCENGTCVVDPCFGTNALDCGTEACRDATCIATCAGVDCGVGEACEDGLCVVQDCGTFSCPPGQTCVDGQCAQNPCGGVTCGTGRVCKDGECVDDPCRLIVCPSGTNCENGQCVSSIGPDGGVWVDAGPGPDGGHRDAGDATDVDGGSTPEFRLTAGGGGCACQGAGSSGSPGGLLLGLWILGMLIWRRRRY